MDQELRTQLEQIALKRSIPFCYHCYVECPSGNCDRCASDDLMRSVRGVACEYGCDWIVEHIFETELTPANTEEAFEQMIRECYPETTKVAWLECDTVQILKDQDPVSWRCALSDYESQEEADGTLISLDGSTYYWRHDVEKLLE